MSNLQTSCHIEFLPPNDSLSVALQQERERLIGRVVETFFVDLSVSYNDIVNDGISVTRTTFDGDQVRVEPIKLVEFYKAPADVSQ